MVRGLSSMMVFVWLPSILFAWHAVHKKRIESKPFPFAQNFWVCEYKFQLSNDVHRVILSSCWNFPWNRYRDTHLKCFSLSKPKKLQMASYEWEHCWILKSVFVAGKCNKICLQYLLLSNGNLTLVFHARVVAIKTDESVTLVRMVRIDKQEANLVAHPETLSWYKRLDVSFLSVFRGILMSSVNGNS